LEVENGIPNCFVKVDNIFDRCTKRLWQFGPKKRIAGYFYQKLVEFKEMGFSFIENKYPVAKGMFVPNDKQTVTNEVANNSTIRANRE